MAQHPMRGGRSSGSRIVFEIVVEMERSARRSDRLPRAMQAMVATDARAARALRPATCFVTHALTQLLASPVGCPPTQSLMMALECLTRTPGPRA
jgi:hypothetical protein